MSGFLMTAGRGRFGGAPRSMEESPGHAAEEPATPDVDVPHDAESVDGIAGSEFVDDRIRLRE